MRITRQHSAIPETYTVDEFLHLLAGHPVEQDSLLRKACVQVWDMKPDSDMPSSLDVALLLSQLGSDTTTLIVALLSTTRLVSSLNLHEFEAEYGKTVVDIVKNVVQLHGFQVHDANRDTPEQAESLRRMLLSMVDDVRAVLVKLAFRVQRLRQLATADAETRQAIAQESLELYAPIANRLGIGQLKWELEDLSFRYLEPSTYKRIAKYLEERREDRVQFVQDVVEKLKTIVAEAGIKAEIYGRPKHIYSIWKKMISKQRDFNELFDVRAVRIVVDSIADCYVVLGLVHGQWRHIAQEFDDYIANPKENGYQSLHTAVFGPGGKPVEVQIRTRQMHEFAEHGVAAHWRYKEGDGKANSLQAGVDSLRRLLDPNQTDEIDLLDNFRTEIFQDRVFVLTPEGRVIDLPQGATPLDFAYAVHSGVGHRCRGAKVNGHIVQLTYKLHNGEQVEILTSNIEAPRRDWLIPHLGYVTTSRARHRIRSWFRKQDEAKNLQDGKQIYDKEIRRYGVRPEVMQLVQHFKMKSADDLYIALARGDLSSANLVSALHDIYAPEQTDEEQPDITKIPRHLEKAGNHGGINVLGVGNLLTTVANCCKPVPGDEIIGFITRGKGVSVHRKDCSNIINLEDEKQQRLIEVEWGDADIQTYPVNLLIEAVDRTGLLSDITKTLADEKVNVIAVNTLSDKKHQTARMAVTVEIQDLQQLNRIMDKVNQLPNVTDVSRGSNSRGG